MNKTYLLDGQEVTLCHACAGDLRDVGCTVSYNGFQSVKRCALCGHVPGEDTKDVVMALANARRRADEIQIRNRRQF